MSGANLAVKQTLIFDAYEAYLGIAVQAMNPDVLVIDGPSAHLPTEQDVLMIGVDDPIAEGMISAIDNVSQDWAATGGGPRDEAFAINASFVIWVGDEDGLVDCRTRASRYVQRLGNAISMSPRGTGDSMLGNVLNQAGDGVGWCGITAVGPMKQIQTSKGPALHVQVVLGCQCRV